MVSVRDEDDKSTEHFNQNKSLLSKNENFDRFKIERNGLFDKSERKGEQI